MTTSQPAAHATPAPAVAVRVAYSWIKSINAKNVSQSSQFLAPRDKEIMDWNSGDSSGWPTFTGIRCKAESEKASNQKDVLCTFNESPPLPTVNNEDPPGTYTDDFWTVTLRRQPDGSWLIADYGTG
jgi:hypothetical protein